MATSDLMVSIKRRLVRDKQQDYKTDSGSAAGCAEYKVCWKLDMVDQI